MESQEILKSFMPKDFPLEKFELKKIDKKKNKEWWEDGQILYPESLSYYFEEKANIPKWYTKTELKSKWFTEYKTISDLPLRNNFFKIKIRMRKWEVKETKAIIVNKLEIQEKWTKNTRELSFFLNTAMIDA